MQMVRSFTHQGEDRALFQMFWEAAGGPVAGGISIRLRSAKRRGSEGSCMAGANADISNSGAADAKPKPVPPAKAQAGDDCSCSGSGALSSC